MLLSSGSINRYIRLCFTKIHRKNSIRLIIFLSIFFKEKFGIQDASKFSYLNKTGCYTVDGTNDSQEFQDVLNALTTIKVDEKDQTSIFKTIAGVLHLGNIRFKAVGDQAQTDGDGC